MNKSGTASIGDAIDGETTDESTPEVTGESSVSQQIASLKDKTRMPGYAGPAPTKAKENPFKSEDTGKITYFYKNMTNQGIILPNLKAKFDTWEPGGVVDLLEVMTEEEVLAYRHIKKMENPIQGKPLIMRLTERQYLKELQTIHEIQMQENKQRMPVGGNDSGSEPISHAVLSHTSEIKKYEVLTEKERAESLYNPYSFIKWVRTYTFNENEFNYMKAQIKNTQALQSLIERKSEIDSV